LKKQFFYQGSQQEIVTKLRNLRTQWGMPGRQSWQFTGNYRKIVIEVQDPKMEVWLILSDFKQF